MAGTGEPRLSLDRRLRLLFQLLATAAVLAWAPGNLARLAAMVVIWRCGFGRLTPRELGVMAAVNLLFLGMNLAALRRGIFAFTSPDLLGIPAYEPLMWGFYTMHTMRLLDGRPPPLSAFAVIAAVLFAAPFGSVADPAALLFVSASLLIGCLALFHDGMDFAYAGYMAAMGALIEFVGVATGQWHYPRPHAGGVPLWSFVMWAGVGLFTRRLILPLLSPEEARQTGGL